MRTAVQKESNRLVRNRSINVLIRNANEAGKRLAAGKYTENHVKDFIKKRNAVINTLGQNNKTPRMKEILLNIKRRKNTMSMNRIAGRFLNWRQLIAIELNRTPGLPPVSRVQLPVSKPPNWQYQSPPRGTGIRNTAHLARFLAASGL